MYDLIIIGGGPAGVSAALYTTRANLKTLIIENGANALARAHLISNYYGVTATGSELYAKGLQQAKELGTEIIHDEVVAAEYTGAGFSVTGSKMTEPLGSRALLLATGVKNATLNLPGLAALTGRGISYCAVCDGFFFRKKRVAVLGSGKYALHEAEYLKHLAGSLVILTNGDDGTLLKSAGFAVDERKLSSIGGEDKLRGVIFEDGAKLELDGLFIALGTADSTDLARKIGAQLDGRFIKTDGSGATNVPGLFAAGDCTGGTLQVAKAVCDGMNAASGIIRYLRSKK